jgi:hypothetical protein
VAFRIVSEAGAVTDVLPVLTVDTDIPAEPSELIGFVAHRGHTLAARVTLLQLQLYD